MMNPSKGGPVLLLHFHSQWNCHAGRCHGIVLENFSSTMDASRAMPPAINRLAALAWAKSLTSDLGSPRSISAVVRLAAFCFFSLPVSAGNALGLCPPISGNILNTKERWQS